MNIETRAQRAGAGARAAAHEGMDLMSAMEQVTSKPTQNRPGGRVAAIALAAVVLIGVVVAIPLLSSDPATPAAPDPQRVSALGLSVAVPEGWSAGDEQTTDFIGLGQEAFPDAPWILIYEIDGVWDPDQAAMVPIPADGFAASMRTNPSFDVLAVSPVTVAGQQTESVAFKPVGGTYLVDGEAPFAAPVISDVSDQDPVSDLTPTESGLATEVVVDGRTLLIQTWWNGARPSEAIVKAYDEVLSSATITS
jgi:hypothetical protein